MKNDIEKLIKSTKSLSKEKLFALATYLLENYEEDLLKEFCKENITLEDAQDIVFSKDDVMEEYLTYNEFSLDQIIKSIADNPKDIAYSIAYDMESESAKELLRELMYYKTMGRL